MSQARYRADIDGLRAIAVTSVVIYHAFGSILPGGFVGVDIFFVISGYLISGHISNDLARGRFSMLGFYARRIRRIFPALLVVLVSCFFCGWFLLLTDEYKQLNYHIFGGAVFISNFVIWGESGYFDNAAITKPLLHLWSLGIEEQFYIIWPLMLWACSKARVNAIVAISLVLVVSLAANLHYAGVQPTRDFFSPATRFWELAIGAMLAHLESARAPMSPRRADVIACAGLIALAAAVGLIRETDAFPGFWALLPTLGAAAVVSGGGAGVVAGRILGSRVAVFIGLISYPLYLWHWPLLSFLRISVGDEPSFVLRAAAVLASVCLAQATYLLIERPIRRAPVSAARTIVLLAMLLAVGLCGLVGDRTNGFVAARTSMVGNINNIDADLDWPYELNDFCLKTNTYDFSKLHWWFCSGNMHKPPRILILGDSFANDVVAGFSADAQLGTQSVIDIGACYPTRGVTNAWNIVKDHPCFGPSKAREETYIDDFVLAHPSIKYAVLNAAWPDFDQGGAWVNRWGKPTGQVTAPDAPGALSSEAAFARGLDARITFLEKQGITVILFLPKPELKVDIKTCFARPFRAPLNDCSIAEPQERDRQKPFRDMAEDLARKHPHLLLFDKYSAFCAAGTCRFIKDGRPLLRDDVHLSQLGSGILAHEFVKWAASHVPGILSP